MTNTGIRRKVDDLGRVVIPAGIRRSLSIREGDAVEVHVEGDQVILSKPSDRCVFCGEEEELETFREKALCRGCVAGVGVLDESVRRSRAPEPAAAEPARRDPSDLPPWPVGEQGGNGGSRRQVQRAAPPRSGPARDDRDDRNDRSERPERPERSERAERPERPERAEGTERSEGEQERRAPWRDRRDQDPPASTTAW